MSDTLKQNLTEAQEQACQLASFSLKRTNYKSVGLIGKGAYGPIPSIYKIWLCVLLVSVVPAYGCVCCAVNTLTGEKVAIKRISKALSNPVLARRSLREFRILKFLHHANVLRRLDSFARKGPSHTDIYIVLELMESDLSKIIYSEQVLTRQHHQKFMFQLFDALTFLHASGVIHRDLKPSNIMINSDCKLKIGDFGMARFLTGPESNKASLEASSADVEMTQYVATRWYRAPELLMMTNTYSSAVDVWSAGCIFGELIQRSQLFPGRDRLDQLKIIFHYCGPPPDGLVLQSSCRHLLKCLKMTADLHTPLPWKAVLPTASKEAIDLLEEILQLDPKRRFSAEKALNHSFFDALKSQKTSSNWSNESNNGPKNLIPADPYPEKDIEKIPDKDLADVFLREIQSSGGLILNTDVEEGSGASATDGFFSSSSGSEGEDGASGNEVEMLSAKMSHLIVASRQNKKDTATTSSKIPDSQIKDVLKQALAKKLEAKQKTSQDLGGKHAVNATRTTAQQRHQEKVEKKKRYFERREHLEEERHDCGPSSNDRQLLDRWKEMQEKAVEHAVHVPTLDEMSFPEVLINSDLPHNEDCLYRNSCGFEPLESLCSPDSASMTTHVIEDVMQSAGIEHGDICMSATSSQSKCDSAQIMELWLQATELQPEELENLEQQIGLKSL